jgi:hypothetical protein
MNQPLRIVHLIDSLKWGGAQQLLVTYAGESARRGLALSVISLKPDTGQSRPRCGISRCESLSFGA